MGRKGVEVQSYLPDTSVVIERTVSKLVEKGELEGEVLIHEGVLAELEHQANLDKPTGLMGLDEIKKLRELQEDGRISVEYVGKRPHPEAIKHANEGEIDAQIRGFAKERNAELITADKVQHEVALASGVRSKLVEFEKDVEKLGIEEYFDELTMSIHLKEETTPKAKRGKPGEWEFTKIRDEKTTNEEMKKLSKEIIEKANLDPSSFIEIDNRGSTIVQFRNYRIVMTRPPLSDGWEITAVRPVKILTLDDYNVEEKLRKRFEEKAEGILVAGAPGNGKSTFCQALGNFYLKYNKIVKTVEAPRDLILPPEITQYSKNIGSNSEIHDILLLSRPDYTIFDEIRNTDDFELFKDMRLSGVGMVGVVHATNPIDAIQRFIGRVELGMVPSIIDTVIYIEKGQIGKVLEVNMTVRVPSGMTEADLARPIVEVKDFLTRELVYEMYTFGEQTVVVPVEGMDQGESGVKKIARGVLRDKLEQELPQGTPFEMKIPTENTIELSIPDEKIPRVIGKNGKNIDKLEEKIGMHIQVKELEEGKEIGNKNGIKPEVKISKNSVELKMPKKLGGKDVEIYAGNNMLMSGTVSKNGTIKISKRTKIGKKIMKAEEAGRSIQVIR